MAKIMVLGSSAEFPLPRTKSNKFADYLDIQNYQKSFALHCDPLCTSAKKGDKDRRTRSCLAIALKNKVILLDAGPDILYQLRKYQLKADLVFVSHAHPDAAYGLRYLKNFHPPPQIFSEKLGNIKPGRVLRIFGIKILPFRIPHSKIAPYTGLKIWLPKTVIYASDMAALTGLKKYFQDCDILFADGSILKRNLPGHLSITNQLKFYKRWRLPRVIFTHLGHKTLSHENLQEFIKSRYQNAEVAYDGMVILA